MQSKQQIEQLLASAGVRPNKRLGQHFLIDLNLMRILVESANIHENDIVLEVGCGTGSLTEALALDAGKVIAVEYDKTLASIASRQLKNIENTVVVNTDILESKNTLSSEVVTQIVKGRAELSGRFLLVANLPYSVSAAVMLNLITGDVVCDSMYVTVQKEVAERMAAGVGGKNYGILGIMMSAAGTVRIIRKLGRGVFWPQPEVESSIVSYVRDKKKVSRIHNIAFLKETVNLFMGHRRKMLKACVKFAEGKLEKVHSWGDIFERAFVEPHHRGEELGSDDYISIANLCYEQLRDSD